MKKFFYLSLFIFSFSFSNAQTWNWAKSEPVGLDPFPNYMDHIIASDNIGNIYYTNNSGSLPDIAKFNENGTLLWYTTATCGNCSSTSITTYSGTEYIAGYFSVSLSFQTDTVINPSVVDLFVAKFDSTGAVKWIGRTKNVSQFISAGARAVACDGWGNLYVSGWCDGGTVYLGNDSIVAGAKSTPILMKFDFNGNPKWIRAGLPLKSTAHGKSNALAVDNMGNSYLAGEYYGSLIFGADTLQNDTIGPDSRNAFLVKYDSAGNRIWAWNAPRQAGAGNSTCAGVGVDLAGNAYLAGSFDSGTVSLGTHTFGPVTGNESFYSKFNSSGSVSWAHEVMEIDTNIWGAVSMATDTLSNSYMLVDCSSGDGSYTLKLGADTFKLNTSSQTADLIVEFDSTGNIKCGTIFTEGLEDDGDNINVSRSGKYVYLTGDVAGICPFGPDTISGSDAFFVASWQPCNPNVETETKAILNNSGLSVFPNPSNGLFTISFVGAQNPDGYRDVPATIEIYNVLGEKVFSQFIIHHSPFTIDLSNQPNGIYFYRVLSIDGSLVGEGKVIVQK